MRVSTAEFLDRTSDVATLATTAPVTITDGGEDKLVLLSSAEYARLLRRDRIALMTEELDAADIRAIAAAEPPAAAAAFDRELGLPTG